MSYKVDAVILKSKDIKEVDRIYTIFSREKGKQKIVGKGVRKSAAKLTSALEPLTHSEIFLVEGRWLDRVTGVIIHNQFKYIRKEDLKIHNSRVTLDIIDQLANEKEPNKEIFDSLIIFLEKLDNPELHEQVRMRIIQLGLIWKMIKWTGFQPEVFSCARCKQHLSEKETYYFNVSFGIQCKECAKEDQRVRVLISKDSVKLLRIFFTKDLELVSRISVGTSQAIQLLQITKLTLEEILGKRVYL